VEFELARVKELISIALQEPSTGDAWLDARYQEDVPIIGHTNPYYKLFWLIAKEFKPKFSVELGTYRGVTAGHIAVGNPDGLVYTVDWHRDAADKVHQKCAIAMDGHYPTLSYINGCSWDVAVVQRVASMSKVHPIDILYIDAWHWYEYAKKEWDLYTPMLADEALVVCDDIFDMEGATVDMVKFWNEVSAGRESFLDTSMHSWIPMGFIKWIR
jgi:predicted O-methyltransferase YrrM